MRIDKLFSSLGLLSRSECKKAIKSAHITVNGITAASCDTQVDPEKDLILYKGAPVSSKSTVYYMLYKPAGVVTANKDNAFETVFSFITDKRKDLSAVGRLDKDTTGILLITNDGMTNHRLLSAKYHVPKTYIAVLDGEITEKDLEVLENGVDIGDEEPTLPAKACLVGTEDGISTVSLTIIEGRYHQVKRMFQALGRKVVKLHRQSFGPLELDPDLEPGCFRELTDEEICALKEKIGH